MLCKAQAATDKHAKRLRCIRPLYWFFPKCCLYKSMNVLSNEQISFRVRNSHQLMHMAIGNMLISPLVNKGLDIKHRLSIVKQSRAYHKCTTPAPS